MVLTQEQITTLLASAGVLGPHGTLRALANNNIATEVTGARVPVSAARAFLIEALFLVRDRTAGTVAVQRQRVLVQGGAVPVIVAGSNVSEWVYVGNIANAPTLALSLAGTNIIATAQNPLAAPAAGIDVDVTFFGPYPSQN